MHNAQPSTDPEAAIELSVAYQHVNAFFADYAKNISRGGSFINTSNPLAVGTEFVFVLEVPKLDEPLRFHGTVMWVTNEEDASKANPAGMGIEFRYSSDAERMELQLRIESLMSTELGHKLTEDLLGR